MVVQKRLTRFCFAHFLINRVSESFPEIDYGPYYTAQINKSLVFKNAVGKLQSGCELEVLTQNKCAVKQLKKKTTSFR